MKILMISGKSCAGKDTVAELMRQNLENCGCNVLIIHFADLVKYFATKYYNWNGKNDQFSKTLLQHIENQMRDRYPTYWADIAGKFINVIKEYDNFQYCIIADWHFNNEYETIAKYANADDIYRIRVKRLDDNGLEYLNPLMTPEQLAHPSECDLDWATFDWMIYNSNNMIELEENVKLYLHYLDKNLNF